MLKMERARLGWIIALAIILAVGIFQPRLTRVVVTYDTPVEGQITDSNPEEVWTLTAPAKDWITITVDRSGGTLAPGVELRDGNGQRMTSADTDYTYAKATIANFSLPAAGSYSVAVSRNNGKDGKTSGNYKLTVSLLGAGEDNPILKAQPKPIAYDTATDGEITAGRWKESWSFNATGKDTISITAQRKDSFLWPELLLLDSSSNPVGRASYSRDGLSSNIDHFKLPGSGVYTVVVKRYGDQEGRSLGKYTVTVALDGAGDDRPELAKPQGPATLDGMVNGTLTNAKWMDVWTLDATSKDHILVTMTRMDGTLVPEVILYGANNQELQHARANDPYNDAKIDFDLPGPGKYQIRAQRENGEDGDYAGKYQLTVAVLGTGDDNPKFKTSTGEVKVGTPTTGTLTNAKWMDSYTVNFATADPIDITVKRTSGTLFPTFKILNANSQEINGARADDTFAVAHLDQFTIPGPGKYTIVVSRESDVNGQTSGGYELDVTQGKKQ
jgi:hypothetical protein